LLRLEFDHSHLEYFTELDAVLLVGTRNPIPTPEVQQVCSSNLRAPIRKLTAQILQLNIHNIPPQVGLRQALKVSISHTYIICIDGNIFLKIPAQINNLVPEDEFIPVAVLFFLAPYLYLFTCHQCYII